MQSLRAFSGTVGCYLGDSLTPHTMFRLIISRVLSTIPLLFVISILAFSMVHLMPGSIAVIILDAGATAEGIAELEAEMGLDRPFIVQYLDWLIAEPIRAVALHGTGIPVTVPQPAKFAAHRCCRACPDLFRQETMRSGR